MLLLACSSDTSAIQLGKQFQDDIWHPWLDRCEGQGIGRLVIAFTKASVLLRDAQKEVIAAQEMGEEEYARYNADGSFSKKIWVNAIDPLTVRSGTSASVISPTDPSTWPPMFFFEASDVDLEPFRDDEFRSAQASAVATKLCSLLDNPSPETESALPIGQRCILRLARDWNSFSRAQQHKLVPVKQWIVRSFCSLLCPQNAGFLALTECIFDYTTIGPVAINHATDRFRDAERVTQAFRSLLSQLGEPSGKEDAVRELIHVNEMLKKFWEKYPQGISLKKGECCARRLEDVDANASPLQSYSRPFKIDDV